MILCWKNVETISEGIGIGNEFLTIAPQEEPLIGSGDKFSFLIFSCIWCIALSKLGVNPRDDFLR